MADTNLDFTKVEALRKHMMLNAKQMAQYLGVSRVTYTGWVKGKPVRSSNRDRVKERLRKMLDIMVKHNWPQPDIIAMSSKQRFDTLLELSAEEG